jgi:dTDP-L-rhamnose 4-epimerase
MKVVVTGGAGFIGSHIVDALIEQGADVFCIDSLDPGVYQAPPPYLNREATYCFADLRAWRPGATFNDAEAVIHLAALGGVSRAAREPENIISANCGGTARLAEAANSWAHLKKFILAGSFSVYGSNYSYHCARCGLDRNGHRTIEDLEAKRFDVLCKQCGNEATIVPIKESATPDPLETYGASKYMQELCLRGFTRCPVNIFRFSSVYGDRLRLDDGEATIIAKIAGSIRSGVRPKLFEDGRQIRDWVFVGDLVAAVLTLLNGKAAPSIVNVCSGTPTTLHEASEIIARVYEKDCPPEIVGGYRKGDMRHCLGDASAFTTLMGRRPVPFSEGAALAFGASASELRSERVAQ